MVDVVVARLPTLAATLSASRAEADTGQQCNASSMVDSREWL